jgi:proteasome lid subunit RPN8/RPN11
MTLQLSAAQFRQVCRHAEATYPEECCGLLLGTCELERASDTETVVVREVWPVHNAWSVQQAEAAGLPTDEHNRGDRYWIDPRDMLAAQHYARDRALDVVGVYHSHPDHAAVPSECDRQLAWSSYRYLILSVQQGKADDIRCWSLDADHQFQPDPLCEPIA